MTEQEKIEKAKSDGLNLFQMLGDLMLSPDPKVAKKATAAGSNLTQALYDLFKNENN